MPSVEVWLTCVLFVGVQCDLFPGLWERHGSAAFYQRAVWLTRVRVLCVGVQCDLFPGLGEQCGRVLPAGRCAIRHVTDTCAVCRCAV